MDALTDTIRAWWDRDAQVYDQAKGHAIDDPVEAAAWRSSLQDALPPNPARVLDAGAGTGAITMLLADLGYHVTALDLSEGMLGRLRSKLDGTDLPVETVVGDVAEPPPGPFDAVVERHVLWTLPDPMAALRAWREAVVPGGRLAVFERVWQPSRSVLERSVRDGLHLLRGHVGEHHAPYPREVLDRLTLPMDAIEPLASAVAEAGWQGVRLRFLRDVDRTARARTPVPERWLDRRPRYALIADAPQ